MALTIGTFFSSLDNLLSGAAGAALLALISWIAKFVKTRRQKRTEEADAVLSEVEAKKAEVELAKLKVSADELLNQFGEKQIASLVDQLTTVTEKLDKRNKENVETREELKDVTLQLIEITEARLIAERERDLAIKREGQALEMLAQTERRVTFYKKLLEQLIKLVSTTCPDLDLTKYRAALRSEAI